MIPPPSDDELDALLLLVRRETAREIPGPLRALIHARLHEPEANVVVRFLSLATLSVGALVLAIVVPPALSAMLATVWWVLPIAGGAWVVARGPS
jgi:hypothetical protein